MIGQFRRCAWSGRNTGATKLDNGAKKQMNNSYLSEIGAKPLLRFCKNTHFAESTMLVTQIWSLTIHIIIR